MTSYEPEEDADALDDDALLERYLGASSTKKDEIRRCLPEWPPLAAHDVALNLDAETISWFRAHHADWRRQMGFVLRAWVVAHTKPTLRSLPKSTASLSTADAPDQRQG